MLKWKFSYIYANDEKHSYIDRTREISSNAYKTSWDLQNKKK